jgi:hypothetical protein
MEIIHSATARLQLIGNYLKVKTHSGNFGRSKFGIGELPVPTVLRTTMAYFRIDDKHISQSKFADIPAVGDKGEFVQAPCSIEGRSTSSVLQVSSQHGESLREGDLITGIIDIANERTRMVPTI